MMNEKEILEIALEEYRSLWSYYHKLLGEWKNFIDWYFKVVTLPGAILGYVALKGPGSPEVPSDVLAAVLTVVALVGFSLYIGYSKEARNGKNYEAAMASIRSFFRNRAPLLEGVLTIDDLRDPGIGYRFGSIKFWRGFSMAIINSGVGAGAISIATRGVWLASLLAFISLIFFHIAIFHLFMRT